jgi:hypothetical protein
VELAQLSQDAVEAVLRAFDAARRGGLPPVECYRAGISAWRRLFPDHAPEYAAKEAVSLILAATTQLTVQR